MSHELRSNLSLLNEKLVSIGLKLLGDVGLFHFWFKLKHMNSRLNETKYALNFYYKLTKETRLSPFSHFVSIEARRGEWVRASCVFFHFSSSSNIKEKEALSASTLVTILRACWRFSCSLWSSPSSSLQLPKFASF